MTTTRAGLLLLASLMVFGCQLAPRGLSASRTRQHDEGAVYLYLQPAARNADRVRVSLAAVAALRADGAEVALAASRRDANDDLGRQRLLASGPLPAGDYTGFVLRVAGASVRRGDRAAPLVVADTPVRIEHPFRVRRGTALVLGAALRAAGSLDPGSTFAPAFAVYLPERRAVGLMGFVANARSDDVTVFDKKALEVFEVIATGRGPTGMALDQRARLLYVALAGDDGIEVIDVAAGTVTQPRIRLTPGDEPVAVALTPDARTLLAANRASNTVSVIDADSRFEVVKVRVGSGPRSITIDRTGRLAFVFNALSNAISVIDIPSRTVVRSIPTEPGPVQGQFNRDATRLYVIYETASYVSVINPRTFAVTARFQLRSPMDAIRVDPATDLVYLAGQREFTVGVHEPFAFGPVDFVETGTGIAEMAIDLDENSVYLVSRAENRVLVADRIRKRVLDALDVGDGPSWVSVMGER